MWKLLVEIEGLEGDSCSSAVHGHVQATEFILGSLQGSLDISFRGDIDRDKDHIVSQFLGHLVALGRGQVAEDDSGSGFDETLDSGTTQAASSAGNQADAVLGRRGRKQEGHRTWDKREKDEKPFFT